MPYRVEPMAAADGGLLQQPVDRMTWIDVARGIGIVLVVYGHALRGLYPRIEEQPNWVRVQDALIYAFHMPLFFILAGYWLWPSLTRGRSSFFRKKSIGILYPYFLWSLIAGGLELIAYKYVNTPISVRDIVMIPVAPIEQFWFLYALFFGQVIIALIFPHRALLSLAALGSIYLFTFPPFDYPTIVEIAMATFYLAVGVFSAAQLDRLSEEGPVSLLCIGVTAWSLFAIVFALDPEVWPRPLVLALAGSVGVFAAAVALSRVRLGALELLGRGSMAIYVMHTIASAAVRVAFIGSDLGQSTAAMLAVTTFIGLLAPLLVWWLVGLSGSAEWFGLPRASALGSAKPGASTRPV